VRRTTRALHTVPGTAGPLRGEITFFDEGTITLGITGS
jgi:hypothetical protein